jgi:hypothetical protein
VHMQSINGRPIRKKRCQRKSMQYINRDLESPRDPASIGLSTHGQASGRSDRVTSSTTIFCCHDGLNGAGDNADWNYLGAAAEARKRSHDASRPPRFDLIFS